MTEPSTIETIAHFRSEILGNERELYIYLPPDYAKNTDKTYPVLYIHDGQNVFASAFNGQSWNLHRVCDRLIAEQRMEAPIIVAVSNMGMARNSEFAHSGAYADELDYPCRGEAYERFMIDELKPYIDRTYRTKPESRHTALMGSSRGGLVTYHIGFRRSDVFGMLAMMSPYFAQYDESAMTHHPIVQEFEEKRPLKLWIDAGGMEGMTVRVDHVRERVGQFLKLGYRSGEDLLFCYEPEAEHNEEAWERRVHGPLLYFFGNIGKPLSAELIGSECAGISGAASFVYPVVRYESGLDLVDLEGSFRVTPDGAAKVSGDGEIFAREAGDCRIEYRNADLRASHSVEIVPALPEEVTVDLEVIVPADTPAGARIYAGVELEAIGPNKYGRRFSLPRGTGFAFLICEYSGLTEAREDGAPAPKRRFVACEDLALRYEVQSWMQGQTI